MLLMLELQLTLNPSLPFPPPYLFPPLLYQFLLGILKNPHALQSPVRGLFLGDVIPKHSVFRVLLPQQDMSTGGYCRPRGDQRIGSQSLVPAWQPVPRVGMIPSMSRWDQLHLNR